MNNRLFLTFLFVPFSIFAATHPDVGTTSFSFLKIETGARPAAMGCAFVSVSDDLNALWWNPAGISLLEARSGMTTYRNYFAGAQSGMVAYAQPFKPWGVAGGSIVYESSGETDKTDDDGAVLGTYSSNMVWGTASFARSFTNTGRLLPFLLLPQQSAVGVSLKYLYMNIDDYYSMALAMDIGVLHKVLYNKGITLGLVAQNLGFQVKPFIEKRERLPMVLRAGVSYPPQYIPLTLSLDMVKPIDNYLYFSLGGEFKMTENIFLRAGYSFNRKDDWVIDSEQDKFMGAGLGVGLHWRKYAIDYAYAPAGQLGSVNRFSFIGSF
jgi:hypothetical protein